MLKRKQTKESGSQAPAPEENRKGKLKGDHLWNSCGSEAGQDEMKPTESPVREPGENGENRRSESRKVALRKPLRGGDRKKGKRRTEG